MKHIKLFENTLSKPTCWMVPTKYPDFIIACKKIGAPVDKFRFMIGSNDNRYIFLFYREKENIWTSGSRSRVYDSIFMGKVNVSEDEIDMFKYNL